jgi:hypothetical protein
MVKRQGREADRLYPFGAEVNNPHMFSMPGSYLSTRIDFCFYLDLARGSVVD